MALVPLVSSKTYQNHFSTSPDPQLTLAVILSQITLILAVYRRPYSSINTQIQFRDPDAIINHRAGENRPFTQA